MTNEAWGCVDIFMAAKKAGDKLSMKQVATDVAEENGKSFEGLYKRLTDNSDKWQATDT